jgi:hypothetical protein
MDDRTTARGSDSLDGQHAEPAREPRPYDAPRIESTLSADDLEREIHYAGVPSNQTG